MAAHRRSYSIDETTGPAVLTLAFGFFAVAFRGALELLLAGGLAVVGRWALR